jgi:hypothetical protein
MDDAETISMRKTLSRQDIRCPAMRRIAHGG